MTTLCTLPPEIILIITSNLDYQCEVNALSQVSRNLYCILDPILYQIDARNKTSHAMSWATIHGSESTALKAIAAGSQPTESTLCLAITHGQENMVQLLLDKGVGPNKWTDSESLITPFGTAIASGRESTICTLIDNGAVLDSRSGDRQLTPVALAAEAGHLAIVRLLAELGCKLDKPNTYDDTYKDTPLFLAARNGHTDVVRFLLQHGVDPNPKGHAYNAPLWAAMDHVDTVKCLLENGATPTLGMLHAAFSGDVAGLVELFLQYIQQTDIPLPADADTVSKLDTDTINLITICSAWNLIPRLEALLSTISGPSELNGMATSFLSGRYYITTPLMIAAERGHLAAVRLLLDHGADPDGTPTYSDALLDDLSRFRISRHIARPLAGAVRAGNETLVRTLLDHGANPALIDNSAGPLLFMCLHHGKEGEGMFQVLLEAGGSYLLSGAHGEPLWGAVILFGTAVQLRLLLERGMKIPLHLFQTLAPADEQGKFEESWDEESNKVTLLDLLARSTDTDAILSTLVELGFNPMPGVERQICHALFTATLHGNLTLLRFLLRQGFLPNPRFPWSAALLRAAADNRDKTLAEEMVDLLLSTGVHIDMLNCAGRTPLLLSLFRPGDWCYSHAVEIFLARGSHPLFISAEGDCPLTIAARYGNFEAVRALIEEIDARGIPFEDFEGQVYRAVEDATNSDGVDVNMEGKKSSTLKLLRREYWRRRYPVAVA